MFKRERIDFGVQQTEKKQVSRVSYNFLSRKGCSNESGAAAAAQVLQNKLQYWIFEHVTPSTSLIFLSICPSSIPAHACGSAVGEEAEDKALVVDGGRGQGYDKGLAGFGNGCLKPVACFLIVRSSLEFKLGDRV